MKIRTLLDNRLTAVIAGAAVVVTLGAGAGFAAAQIGSADIINDSIKSIDIKDRSVQKRDLSPGTVAKLRGQRGLRGPAGPAGATGPRGPVGATGPAGAALASNVSTTATIGLIGGPFATNSTQVGTLNLATPGTYLITGDAFFDSVAAHGAGTRLMLALRGPATPPTDNFGPDYGTCFTGVFAATADRESTCATSRVITVTVPTVVRVIGFGYNDDASGDGANAFTIKANVAAIKLG